MIRKNFSPIFYEHVSHLSIVIVRCLSDHSVGLPTVQVSNQSPKNLASRLKQFDSYYQKFFFLSVFRSRLPLDILYYFHFFWLAGSTLDQNDPAPCRMDTTIEVVDLLLRYPQQDPTPKRRWSNTLGARKIRRAR
jgi:hypothetical protein